MDKPQRVWFKFTKYLRKRAEDCAKERAELTYRLYLLCSELTGSG